MASTLIWIAGPSGDAAGIELIKLPPLAVNSMPASMTTVAGVVMDFGTASIELGGYQFDMLACCNGSDDISLVFGSCGHVGGVVLFKPSISVLGLLASTRSWTSLPTRIFCLFDISRPSLARRAHRFCSCLSCLVRSSLSAIGLRRPLQCWRVLNTLRVCGGYFIRGREWVLDNRQPVDQRFWSGRLRKDQYFHTRFWGWRCPVAIAAQLEETLKPAAG